MADTNPPPPPPPPPAAAPADTAAAVPATEAAAADAAAGAGDIVTAATADSVGTATTATDTTKTSPTLIVAVPNTETPADGTTGAATSTAEAPNGATEPPATTVTEISPTMRGGGIPPRPPPQSRITANITGSTVTAATTTTTTTTASTATASTDASTAPKLTIPSMSSLSLDSNSNKSGKGRAVVGSNHDDDDDDGMMMVAKPSGFGQAEEDAAIANGGGNRQRNLSISSRDDLRRVVQTRKIALTTQEHQFLEQLCVNGNEIEVQLAMEKLADDSLFFDYQTPTHLKYHPKTDDDEEDNEEGDNHEFFPEEGEGRNDNNENDDVDGDKETKKEPNGNGPKDKGKARPTTRPPGFSLNRENSLGSQRRLQVLEQRRQSAVHGQMWKAHENGIAVTPNASRRSLNLRRQASNTSSGGSGQPVPFPILNVSGMNSTIGNSSMMSNTSLYLNSYANNKSSSNNNNDMSRSMSASSQQQQRMIVPPSAGIFRTRRRGSSGNLRGSQSSFKGGMKHGSLFLVPRHPRPNNYLRSQSLSASSQYHSYGNNSNSSTGSLRRKGPQPLTMDRRVSTSGRKSVTFSGLNAEDVREAGAQTSTTTNKQSSKPKDPLRRSVSDTGAIHPQAKNVAAGMSATVDSSTSSSLIRPGTVDERDESTSTFPSIRPARPIRSDSIASQSSIPSLHHGTPIRSESVSSYPSIRQAHPLRGDSINSIPSLRHGNPLSLSVFSSDDDESEIDDKIAIAAANAAVQGIITIPSPADEKKEEMTPEQAEAAAQDTKAKMLSQFMASDDVANAWLQQQDNRPKEHEVQQQKAAPAISDLDNSTSSFPQNAVMLGGGGTTATITTTDDDDDGKKVAAGDSGTPVSDNRSFAPKDDDEQQQQEPKSGTKPIFMRLASRNTYDGEGIEVTELDVADEIIASNPADAGNGNNDHLYNFRRAHYISMGGITTATDMSIRTVSSWDEASYYSRHSEIFRNTQQHFDALNESSIHRSLSDDEWLFNTGSNSFGPGIPMMMTNNSNNSGIHELFYLGPGLGTVAPSALLKDTSIQTGQAAAPYFLDGTEDMDDSWDMNSDSERNDDSSRNLHQPRYDSWNVLKDEYINGYGGGGTLEFLILGTSADDESAKPHVLSPPLMESLQSFLPFSKSGENFFLKYSMVRDGASLHTFLKRARGVQYSVLALETVDGEVFGAFTAQAWRKNWNYFGTGESFLWRMRRSRLDKTSDVLKQAQLESEIDVYPYTGDNSYIQLCTHDRIAVGGGNPASSSAGVNDMSPEIDVNIGAKEINSTNPASSSSSSNIGVKDHEWGFGLAIQGDFLEGTTSPCMTFGSPSLSHIHADGGLFEIVNLELWTLTPCMTVEQAEKMDLGRLFLERH